MHFKTVAKPIKRSKIRFFFGKEYFILKRRFKWMFDKKKYSKVEENLNFENSLIKHSSFLLRPLKDVDMQLQFNKVTNLQLAIQKINNVVIYPGETFSLWKLVGRPNKFKGYLKGMTLHNGQISSDIGGGLCQLGNLLYWMILHSELNVRERWRHGYDVFPDINRTIPFACGATLSYNYIDLQFENNTDYWFQIHLWLDETHLHGELKANSEVFQTFEIIETDHSFQHQWWDGYTRHNKIWKKSTSVDENRVNEELVAENNAIMMYSPFIEHKKSD